MRFTTRNKREISIETLDLPLLGEAELTVLCEKLYQFSNPNTQKITPAYLLKRLKNYNVLSVATSQDKIIAFGFADYRKITVEPVRNFPLIHFGLMIVDSEWRGDRVSRLLSKCTVKFVTRKNGIKTFFTGFAISAKCSSPVSFYRLQQASLKLGFPKFNKHGELDSLSKSRIGKTLSQNISRTLGMDGIGNFIIENSNVSSGFQLSEENYVTNTTYEKNVLSFFKKNVLPHHEVLFISYGHPFFIL